MQQVEVLEGIRAVAPERWNALVGDDSPFLEWEWLASLEEAGCVGGDSGWQPSPLVVRDGERLLAACPLYLKSHSEGEFVFDWSWADAAERAGIRYYPKLLVGVPFTPVTGSRFLLAPGEAPEDWTPLLAEALCQLCRSNQMSGVHVNFCREAETRPLSESEFQLRVGLQYHWQNPGYQSFDDYLSRFRSKRRNQIRRERRAMQEAGVCIEVVPGEAVDGELLDAIYGCYLANLQVHHYWGRQYLNRHFFDLLVQRFRSRLCLVVARRDGEILAGTLNVQKGDSFYGRYWGALRPLRHLHWNVCYYAAIEHCIAQGLRRFEPGAGGDYKFLRGFDATPTYSLHFLAEPRLARAVGEFLAAERQQARRMIEHLGEESALRALPRPE